MFSTFIHTSPSVSKTMILKLYLMFVFFLLGNRSIKIRRHSHRVQRSVAYNSQNPFCILNRTCCIRNWSSAAHWLLVAKA